MVQIPLRVLREPIPNCHNKGNIAMANKILDVPSHHKVYKRQWLDKIPCRALWEYEQWLCWYHRAFNARWEGKKVQQAQTLHYGYGQKRARTLIIFSGLGCIPDAPEAYIEKKVTFWVYLKKCRGKMGRKLKYLHLKMDACITTSIEHGWKMGL